MHSPAHTVARVVLLVLALSFANSLSGPVHAQSTLRLKVDAGEPQWIWAPGSEKDHVPTETCYFRKVFDLVDVEQASVQISCDDRFELFVNGRVVGSSADWKKLQSYNVARFMQHGKNCIGVRCENTTGGSAGLIVRVTVKNKGGTDVSYSTDATWKTSPKEAVGWEKPNFEDSQWTFAQSFGEFGHATPWGDQVAAADGSQVARFTIGPEFKVERVMRGDKTGSLIAMTFNEFGEILASQEQGPLQIFLDKDEDGIPETVETYCEEVKSSQGLMALNGNVFAVGDGPEGAALYKLTDDNHDYKVDSVKALVKFKGNMYEHGPHAVVLGPDGLIYVMLGNHTSSATEPEETSPHHHWYEGDLVQPRYEDPGGHAVGIKAPGGVVLRTDTEGSFVQTFAGGFRNAYDLAFNRQGELFTFDSDMEWDEGLPWYRPHAHQSCHPWQRVWLAQRLGDLARLFRRQLAHDLGRGSWLADRPRVLQPLHDADALSQRDVCLRLGARAHLGHQAHAAERQLRSQKRSLPGRTPAQRHGYRRRPRWLAVFLHRRSRH